MKNVVVSYDESKWYAVPANNGGNGSIWQWGDEILIGYTGGEAKFNKKGHQVDGESQYISKLARSKDGGKTWENFVPSGYQKYSGIRKDPVDLSEGIDFSEPGFLMRVEGNGYHGNYGHQWFYSQDKGENWHGPYTFGNLLEHPQLEGREFTGRTSYIVNGAKECLLFLSVRGSGNGLEVSTTDKVFLAETKDGGKTFNFVNWIVSPSDPHRAVMPASVRIDENKLVASIRRKDKNGYGWIDCCHSINNGQDWSFLSRVGETGVHNGNPPAMIKMNDGRLCCVFGNRNRRVILAKYSSDEGRTWSSEQIIRDNHKSINGYPDLGYPRLFQRQDGKLVTTYFWCSPERPQTHIEATIFSTEKE